MLGSLLSGKSDGKSFISRIKCDIRQAAILEDYAKADKIIKDNKDWTSYLEPLYRRALEAAAVMLKIHQNGLTDEESSKQLEAAIRLTS